MVKNDTIYISATAAIANRAIDSNVASAVRESIALNSRMIQEWNAIADAEVNKLLFAGIGAPVLLAGGAALAPVAGAYAMTLGGTSVSGFVGGLTYYGTSFAVGGAAGGAFEFTKNEIFGLQHTPGGYVGSILGGGIGGTGWQVLGSGAPVLLNNIATGGLLGIVGDWIGQTIDINTGYQTNFDRRSILVSGAIGAAAGSAVPDIRINGLNAGRNNSLSIYNGLQTRISTGSIGQFQLRYGASAGVGQGVSGLSQDAAGSLLVGIDQGRR